MRFFKFKGPSPAKPKWNETEDPERAINQPPPQRNAAPTAEDQCEGSDQDTGDQPKVKEPTVPDGIAPGTDENHRDDEMAEGQPIRAVKQKRLAAFRIIQCIADAQQPLSERGGRMICTEAIRQPIHFQPQRNSGRTAEKQPGNEKQSQPADTAVKDLFTVHGEFIVDSIMRI
jgi:hypothetical protein